MSVIACSRQLSNSTGQARRGITLIMQSSELTWGKVVQRVRLSAISVCPLGYSSPYRIYCSPAIVGDSLVQAVEAAVNGEDFVMME